MLARFLAITAFLGFSALSAVAATPMRCSHQLPPQHEVANVIER